MLVIKNETKLTPFILQTTHQLNNGGKYFLKRKAKKNSRSNLLHNIIIMYLITVITIKVLLSVRELIIHIQT